MTAVISGASQATNIRADGNSLRLGALAQPSQEKNDLSRPA